MQGVVLTLCIWSSSRPNVPVSQPRSAGSPSIPSLRISRAFPQPLALSERAALLLISLGARGSQEGAPVHAPVSTRDQGEVAPRCSGEFLKKDSGDTALSAMNTQRPGRPGWHAAAPAARTPGTPRRGGRAVKTSPGLEGGREEAPGRVWDADEVVRSWRPAVAVSTHGAEGPGEESVSPEPSGDKSCRTAW